MIFGGVKSIISVTKDSDSRKVPNGGAEVKVKVSPGVGVGGSEQDGIVKDMGDGTYTVTYVVPKRGNYMLYVECNGRPILGSPFPVFFSSGTTTGGLLGLAPQISFSNLVNQTMPNMPNYSGSVSGAFPGLLGMIPGIVPSASGGAVLPGIGSSLGEVCREYLNGRCLKTDCKFSHPPHNLLMAALASTTTMGTLYFYFFKFTFFCSFETGKRLGALNMFKAGECNILICIDVASRGLDIPSVDMVINYDIRTNSKVVMDEEFEKWTI